MKEEIESINVFLKETIDWIKVRSDTKLINNSNKFKSILSKLQKKEK